MYDDLSSLTEKLKLSGVSFQVMKDETEGDIQVTASEPLAAAKNGENGTFNTADHSGMSHIDTALSAATIVQMASKSQSLRRKEAQPTSHSRVSVPQSSVSFESGLRKNVSIQRHQDVSDPIEKHPVTLDMLFATIGKKNV